MKLKKILVASVLAITAGLLLGASDFGYAPKDGFVPNEETAIKIAVAVWSPIYGGKKIADEAPYSVKLRDGIWIVQGSVPPGHLGGAAYAEIAKSDGRIVRVTHYQ